MLMMLRNIFLRLLLIVFMSGFITFSLFSQEDIESKEDADEVKNEKKVKIKVDLESETSVEIGFRDVDDSENFDLGLDKNTPLIKEEFYLFTGFKISDVKRLIIGPYFDTELGLRFDNRNRNASTTFLERHYGLFSMGLILGYDFGRKNFKDSYFAFMIPYYLDYRLNYSDIDNALVYTQEEDDLKKYHTSLMMGTKLGFILHLRMKNQFMKFDFEDYLTIKQEVLSGSYMGGYTGFFIENENILEYKLAPFNFINKKVDVWINLYNRSRVNYNSYDIGLEERIYLEIVWSGFKYLHIGWKPFQYDAEVKIPADNINNAYDQKHMISMEVWIGAGYKFFWAVLSYTPILFGLDAPKNYSEINADSLRPHIISASIEFKY